MGPKWMTSGGHVLLVYMALLSCEAKSTEMEVGQVGNDGNIIIYDDAYSLIDLRLAYAGFSAMVGFIMLSSLSWKSQKMLMAWFTEILSVGNNPSFQRS